MTTRRPGRPRNVPSTSTVDPRDEILAVGAHLFTTKGYSASGTREIAAAAGLQQASLFHWFARKDEILLELLLATVRPALERSERLRTSREPPETRLYLLARGDVANLCRGPDNLGSLQLLPEARGAPFRAFWRRRAELRRCYRDLVEGIDAAGHLVVAPVELATDVAFGSVESVITWYERSPHGRRGRAADEVAHAVAASVVRAIADRVPSERVLRRAHDRLVG